MTLEHRVVDALRAKADRVDPAPPDWPDVLRRAGRQRARRARVMVGVAAAAVLVIAAVAATALSTPGHSEKVQAGGGTNPSGATPAAPPTTTRPTTPASARPTPPTNSLVVVDGGYDQVTVYDPDIHGSRPATLVDKHAGDYPNDILTVGDRLVYMAGTVESVGDGLTGAVVNLGAALDFTRSAREGWVWLITQPVDPGPPGPIPTQTVQEVKADGTARGAPVQLPDGAFPVIGVPGGILLATTDSVTVWNQTTHQVGATIPGLAPGAANLVDVHGELLAWVANCGADSTCGDIVVVDLSTGHQRDIPAPAGLGWIPTGGEGSRDAFSADGDYLAVRAGPTTSASNHPPVSQLQLIDLATDADTTVAGSTSTYAFSRVAWSRTGEWVFYENSAHQLAGHNPTNGSTLVLGQTCCGVALATLPKDAATPFSTGANPAPLQG